MNDRQKMMTAQQQRNLQWRQNRTQVEATPPPVEEEIQDAEFVDIYEQPVQPLTQQAQQQPVNQMPTTSEVLKNTGYNETVTVTQSVTVSRSNGHSPAQNQETEDGMNEWWFLIYLAICVAALGIALSILDAIISNPLESMIGLAFIVIIGGLSFIFTTHLKGKHHGH